jgi:peptidoglycan-N-acetylglucosamine deacetylase
MNHIKYGLLTNDVETTSIWFNSLRDETGLKVLREGMPMLLDLYAKHNIKSTFFFTGYIAKLYPEVVKMIQPYGHEVGSHGLIHDPKQAFDVLSFPEQLNHLTESKKILEDIAGVEVISFRAPALRVNKDTPRALIQTGFKIDSSIAPQRFDFFMSFGGYKKLKWFLCPRSPYYTDHNSLFRKGNSPLLEMPLNAYFIPYIGTTMRLFPVLSMLLRSMTHLENKIQNNPLMFLIHPNELIDESKEKVIKVKQRAGNFCSYLVADKLRRYMKIKNLGEKGLRLYEDQIHFFEHRQYQFTTLQDYAKSIKNK